MLNFSQGASGNLCWVSCLGAVGLPLAIVLGLTVPVGVAVSVTAVNDVFVRGTSRLLHVLGAAYAGWWLTGAFALVPLGAGILFGLALAVPYVQHAQQQRQAERKTGFDTTTLAIWLGTMAAAVLGTAMVSAMALVVAVLVPLVADLGSRHQLAKEFTAAPPPRRVRVRNRRKPAPAPPAAQTRRAWDFGTAPG
jgi:hypothetical protein